MKRYLFWILMLGLFSCGTVRNAVKSEVRIKKAIVVQPKPKVVSGFGPWMMPLFASQNAVRLMYVTAQPESTDLYFSMAGEMDWTRGDSEKVRVHSMDFEDLEYSTDYHFEIGTEDPAVFKKASLKTQPWGSAYSFRFEVADAKGLGKLSDDSDFLILTGGFSDKANGFKSFYSNYSKLLSRTPIISTRSFDIEGKRIDFVLNGVWYWDYRDYRVIVLNSEATQDRIPESLFSEASRMIVISDEVDPLLMRSLYATYGDRIIHFITTTDVGLKEQVLLNGSAQFEVEKKSRRTAMNLKW